MRFRKWRKPRIRHGKPTKYGWTVYYPGDFSLGDEVDIGYGTFIQAEYGVMICDKVQIGGNCCIYSKNSINDTKGLVLIHKGARIGAGTIIFPNVVIGEGALIGANSVIKHNVEPNTTVYGVH